jgi:hypothetical protein
MFDPTFRRTGSSVDTQPEGAQTRFPTLCRARRGSIRESRLKVNDTSGLAPDERANSAPEEKAREKEKILDTHCPSRRTYLSILA